MFFGGGDPFEHFANMNGGGMRGGRERGPVDNEGFYKILGVEKSADESAIKKAYRKLAMKHHPDKGGDAEVFKEISTAHDVLTDPEKRSIYDKYGKEGLEEGGGGGSSADDLMSQFFGGGRSRGPRGPQRGEDIQHELKVSLEDLYNGKTVKLAINRDKICVDCGGKGGKEGCEKSCSDCQGRGVRVQLRQIGPGMVQQIQSACQRCKGSGKIMNEKDKCKTCNGKKVNKDRKILEVNVEKGMKNGQKIKFSGEADEAPDTIPGDVVFVIKEREHDQFKRKGADLVMTINLTLSESLCGFTRTITHMDGRVLRIDNEPGKVVKPDAVKMIQGEGMPYHGNPFSKGRLFVHFRVEFPKSVTKEMCSKLVSALPAAEQVSLSGEEEECNMTDVDLSQFGQDQGGEYQRSTYDEDDEDEMGGRGQKVQCQNM